MNKQLLSFPLLLMWLASCSTTTELLNPVSPQLEQSSVTKSTQKRRSKHTLVEGVISVDITSTNNELHLLTGEQYEGKRRLQYQYSQDGGISWSKASKVLGNDNIPAKLARGADAQITAQGQTIYVAWTMFDKAQRFNSGAMLAARSIDHGKSWQQIATPADWKKGPHRFIDLASDKNVMHAVWLDRRNTPHDANASQGLHYASSFDAGLHWQSNQTLDEESCSCCWNTLKTDLGGNAYVLYRDKKPSDLSIGVINSQQKWQYLNHVGAFNWQFDGCPHIGGGLDFQNHANNKRMHAIVGTGHPDHLGVHYSYSDDAGKNWSIAMQLGDESAVHSDIASHDNGRVVAIWDMMSESGLAIFIAESTDQGNHWSEPKQLSKVGMRATHPRIIKTKNGFLAVWTETDGRQQILTKKRL